MAWEYRNGGRYFYRSIWKGDGRVEKRYYGRGPAAEIAAGMVADERARRRAEAEAIAGLRAGLASADAMVAGLDRACRLASEATLVSEGFRRHSHGAWRRLRHGR